MYENISYIDLAASWSETRERKATLSGRDCLGETSEAISLFSVWHSPHYSPCFMSCHCLHHILAKQTKKEHLFLVKRLERASPLLLGPLEVPAIPLPSVFTYFLIIINTVLLMFFYCYYLPSLSCFRSSSSLL